ncbi:MAG: hypothetical protein ACP5J4_07270 [Anaerolineae bacterium]
MTIGKPSMACLLLKRRYAAGSHVPSGRLNVAWCFSARPECSPGKPSMACLLLKRRYAAGVPRPIGTFERRLVLQRQA